MFLFLILKIFYFGSILTTSDLNSNSTEDCFETTGSTQSNTSISMSSILILTTTIDNTVNSKSCDKWTTVKCVVYKYTNSSTVLKKVNINNTDLCDRIDPTYKKNVTDERNKEMEKKLDEIKNKTLNEIQKVKEDYKAEIIANKSFAYIAIISITTLATFVVIMDIIKFVLYKS